ncbi:DNA polymerase [Methanocalculus natronophilus]|uniref:DNA polymerase n=1 Tax=Methanocalculus natronophilus TaxID=1262400 RepID=UPI0031B60569
MRARIMEGPPYSEEEQQAILDYCQSDVEATVYLYRNMESRLDGPRTLLRGRFMAAVASMEYRGIPIDLETLRRLERHWERLQERLIEEVDQSYGVYGGRTFKLDLFEKYLQERGMDWPRTETGRLSLTDDTLKDMTKTYPGLQPLRDLRYILGQLRLNSLAVGSDGRNRTLLSPFRAKTGRNAPSTSKFIFGPAVWLRGLIKPEKGRALAYVDYSQQEFALAAYLSNDPNMIRAYESGDPYLSFAQMAGAAPEGATKQTHGQIRDQFKVCALAVQYGMKEQSLSKQLGKPLPYGKELIQHHKRTFKRFWEWQDRLQGTSLLEKKISTSYGWQFKLISGGDQVSTLRNWPMQATGADILRIAAIMLEDAGIEVLCPVHDAFLVESSIEDLEETVKTCQSLMEEASRQALGGAGFVRTDAEVITYPGRYCDKRGRDTWQMIQRLLDEIEQETGAL